jgi:hypothetical protein
MTSDIVSARRALQRSRALLAQISKEYTSFLSGLRAMRTPLQELGVSFDLADDDEPATVIFTTPVGPIQMDKIMFVEEQHVAYAVVFSEAVAPAAASREPNLWSLQLRWESPWKHVDGSEVRREFVSEQADPRASFDAIANAIAAKLVLNNLRLSLP